MSSNWGWRAYDPSSGHARRMRRYHKRRGTDPEALALMPGWSEDQIEALERAGISARCQTYAQRAADRARRGERGVGRWRRGRKIAADVARSAIAGYIGSIYGLGQRAEKWPDRGRAKFQGGNQHGVLQAGAEAPAGVSAVEPRGDSIVHVLNGSASAGQS